jgi:hypothetical protein
MVMNEIERIAVARSAHESGWLAEKTPNGIPTITANVRLVQARIIV